MAAAVTAGGLMPKSVFADAFNFKNNVIVSGHLWVYASKYPPDWDCTPDTGYCLERF